jgi:branched-chain amino acid transport system substrate-binding protein
LPEAGDCNSLSKRKLSRKEIMTSTSKARSLCGWKRLQCAGAIALFVGIGMAATPLARAESKYGPGVTDKEIKLGQTAPYSGPASAFSTTARVENDYLKMVNAAGGIGGRQINMISLDDGYSPPKTIEQTRKLVEGEEVLAIVGTVGTLANVTITKYLNSKKVPHLFGTSGSAKLNDPVHYPWTVPFFASQDVEGRTYARYILQAKPDAKIAILYQNDDYGRGYLDAFKAELGDKASKMVVKEEPYDVTFPTIDSQIVSLKASGADVFFHATTPKFAAQAIRKTSEIGWKPLQIIPTAVAQISNVLQPAGLGASTGVLTAIWRKEPSDPRWADDPEITDYRAFMKQWAPGEPVEDGFSMNGYVTGKMIVEILKSCGDDLTRENLMKQAITVNDLHLPLFLAGINLNISKDDRVAWRSSRIAKFDGKGWEFISDLMTIPPSVR